MCWELRNFSTISACASAADSIGQGLHDKKRRQILFLAEVGKSVLLVLLDSILLEPYQQIGNPEEASRPFDAKRDGFVPVKELV